MPLRDIASYDFVLDFVGQGLAPYVIHPEIVPLKIVVIDHFPDFIEPQHIIAFPKHLFHKIPDQ